jgi:hypothetical protein
MPLLLTALVLIGNDPPWTTANCIGVAVFLVALIVIIACVGTVRCPLCQSFIGLVTVLRFLRTPQLERWVTAVCAWTRSSALADLQTDRPR